MEKKSKVAALKYDREKDIAPKLIAKGNGYMAEKILEIAKEENIPIYKDEKLVNQLNNLELNEIIPKELYNVVAEVLAFIASVDNSYNKI